MNKIKYILLAGLIAFTPLQAVEANEAEEEVVIEESVDGKGDQPTVEDFEDENKNSKTTESYTNKSPEEIVKEGQKQGKDVVVYEKTKGNNMSYFIFGISIALLILVLVYFGFYKKK